MGLMDIIGSNAVGIDPAEAEADQRQKYPLLLHEDEHIEMAFQVKGFGRDKSFLTTHRLLIKDGKGVGNKRRSYLSLPYAHIQAFSMETAGLWDDDISLKVWTSGKPVSTIEFGKKEVNIWSIEQFMNAKMDWSAELKTAAKAVPNNRPLPSTSWRATNKGDADPKVGVFDWLGGNAHTMDASAAEDQLKTVTPVLMEDETVHLAFRERRDSVFFTSHRLLLVDVQGISGKRVEFISFPWRTFRGFSVQTAGPLFDIDTELKLYTHIRSLGMIHQDFRNCQVDLLAIQTYLSHRLLGTENTPLQAGLDRKEGHVDPKGNFWFRDNQRPLDAVALDQYYHDTVPLLPADEHVELAFKGRRDVTLFTTKRLVDIDPKGLTGTRIEYTSIPWTSIIGFGASTQGKFLDNDVDLMLWTDMMFIPSQDKDGDGEAEPPEPGMSFWNLDFNPKMTNILRLQQYVAQHILQADIPVDPNAFALAPTGKDRESLVDFLGDNQRAIDPQAAEDFLRKDGDDLLLKDERVLMAFQAGRDILLFTTSRILDYDVRGLSGQKIRYTSLPYSSIRSFAAESAGAWDRDAELTLYTRNLWDLKKLSFDFRKGKADIVTIQRFLAAVALGTPEDATRYLSQAGPARTPAVRADIRHFMSFLTDNAKEEDASAVNQQLHDNPPILLSNETVQKAFSQGRDLYLYTTHRLLLVDVQGLTGQRVEYKSYPWQYCHSFEVETAGHLDRDAEVYVHVDVAEGKTVDQSVLVKQHDIYALHAHVGNQLVFATSAPTTADEEPEFVL